MDAVDCALLILRSPYLVALCSYMMLQCCTAALVVSGSSASERVVDIGGCYCWWVGVS